MSINDKLFKLIKNHQKEEFTKIFKENSDIDCNIRDDNNNYLIQYAILYNMPDIINLLISKGSKLDIIDIDGRSLLFMPIKYGYIEALKILLEKDKDNIGVSLLEYSDIKVWDDYAIITYKYLSFSFILLVVFTTFVFCGF